MHKRSCVHARVCEFLYACVCLCMSVCVCWCVRWCVHVFALAHVCTHTRSKHTVAYENRHQRNVLTCFQSIHAHIYIHIVIHIVIDISNRYIETFFPARIASLDIFSSSSNCCNVKSGVPSSKKLVVSPRFQDKVSMPHFALVSAVTRCCVECCVHKSHLLGNTIQELWSIRMACVHVELWSIQELPSGYG